MAITAGYGNAKFVDDAQVRGLFSSHSSFRPPKERETESGVLIDFFPAGLSLSLSNYQISETSLRRARAFFFRAPLAKTRDDDLNLPLAFFLASIFLRKNTQNTDRGRNARVE